MLSTIRPRNFSRFPMLWLAVYLMTGIAFGRLFNPVLWLPVSVAATLVLLLVLKRSAVYFIIPLVFIPLGILCYQVVTKSIADDRIKRIYSDGRIDSGEPVEIEGVLLGLPETAYDGIFITLRVERLAFKDVEYPASGNVRLFALVSDRQTAGELDQLGLRYGSRVLVMCRLEREERFRNPGVASRIEMLDQQGIDATATIKSPSLIEKIGDESIFLPLAWVYEQRQRLITEFRQEFSAQTAGVMIASLLGDKHFLDRRTAEVFRDGGTFHVLVISGLHITFIGGLTLWILSFFTNRRMWQLLLAGSFLWAYTFAVGAEVPVVRATVMFSFLLLSRVIYRKASLLNSLGACLLLLLAWRPTDLFSASFQLTVISVAAIVGCAFPLIEKMRAIGSWTPTAEQPFPPVCPKMLKTVCEHLYWNEAAWRIDNSRQTWSANLFKTPYLKLLTAPNLQSVAAYVFEGLLVSVIVQIWMLPLLVIYFHRVSAASILLNLWVGVFLALESFAAIIAVFVGRVSGWLAAPLIMLAEFLESAMMAVPTLFSEGGAAGMRLPVYSGRSGIVYLLYAVAVVIAAAGIFKWDPFGADKFVGRYKLITIASTAVIFVFAAVIILHPFGSPRADGQLKIDFLDVGQGDSALVTFPNGQTMLVDGGGGRSYGNDDSDEFVPDLPRIGEAVVSEFLWEKGYSRVDYLVITHADADHLQGLIDVAKNFEIGHTLVSGMPTDDAEFSEFLGVIDGRGIPLSVVVGGDELTVGDSVIQVLHPKEDESPSSRSTNNASVVLRIAFGARTFLLTGDIEAPAEAELIHERKPLAADVVKVPHHGSRTSSTEEFVRSTHPDVAIISVGRRSPYGHPHQAVVERWRNAGAVVITTGEKGTITVATNGEDLRISTFVP